MIKLPRYTTLTAEPRTVRGLTLALRLAHQERDALTADMAKLAQQRRQGVQARAYAITEKALAYLEERRNDHR